MKRRQRPAATIIEADLLLSDRKLSRVQVAGSLVLGVAYISLPVLLVGATLYSLMRHESLGFDPLTNTLMFIGACAVAGMFGYAGYRLIRRALS